MKFDSWLKKEANKIVMKKDCFSNRDLAIVLLHLQNSYFLEHQKGMRSIREKRETQRVPPLQESDEQT